MRNGGEVCPRGPRSAPQRGAIEPLTRSEAMQWRVQLHRGAEVCHAGQPSKASPENAPTATPQFPTTDAVSILLRSGFVILGEEKTSWMQEHDRGVVDRPYQNTRVQQDSDLLAARQSLSTSGLQWPDATAAGRPPSLLAVSKASIPDRSTIIRQTSKLAVDNKCRGSRPSRSATNNDSGQGSTMLGPLEETPCFGWHNEWQVCRLYRGSTTVQEHARPAG